MRQDCIHFYDKMALDRTAFIFMTSHYKTGTHPFYIGMYIHIYTHIYVHIYTSQKECLHIFHMENHLNHPPPFWGSSMSLPKKGVPKIDPNKV